MARRQFKIPFAATGDTESIPNETQPDGSVSMQQGYGFDYERDPQTDPLAKVFPRDVHNGLLNEITSSIGEIQQQGYPIWTVDGAPYPINAVVRHADNNWRSKIANNIDTPGVGPGATSWDDLTGAAEERFNAPIATIASAATVNLTAGAPNTSQITITGAASISAFTVAVDRSFVVKFTGACTLVNSGTLVTGTGANIVCAAGDSCIIRSTAANSVEVVTGNFLSQSSIGTRGQAWQDVTGSRSLSTTYTNTTGRPIYVAITCQSTNSVTEGVFVDGIRLQHQNDTLNNQGRNFSFIVPNGSTYRAVGNTIQLWTELRQ